jgi:hypothetical protein
MLGGEPVVYCTPYRIEVAFHAFYIYKENICNLKQLVKCNLMNLIIKSLNSKPLKIAFARVLGFDASA